MLKMSEVEIMRSFRSNLKTGLVTVFAGVALFSALPTVAIADDDRPVINVPKAGGRNTFKTMCTTCHMPDGRGGQNEGGYGADLRVTKLTEDEVVKVITEGRAAKGMPPFKGLIDDEKIRMLAQFIKEDLRLK